MAQQWERFCLRITRCDCWQIFQGTASKQINEIGEGGVMFKVGQLAVNIDEGTTHQIRHIKIQNGEQMLGFGRKRFAWCFAKYYRKYKKVV